MPKITVRFENEAEKPEKWKDQPVGDTIEIDAEEGHSILEALLVKDIHLNHNCGGVCACTTCHIYLHKGEELVEEISDKEEDYIDRARQPTLESRLSCQCVILEEEGEIELTIPDQSDIIGHEH